MKANKHKKTVILIAVIAAIVVCACVIFAILIVNNKNDDSLSVPVEIVETKLKKPENLHVKNGVLKWNVVDGASYYIVYYNGKEKKVDEAEYVIENFWSLENIKIQVRAVSIDENCKDSDLAEYTYVKPAGEENKMLSFTLVPEEDGYSVSKGSQTPVGVIEIPAYYKGKPVVKIEDEGFYIETPGRIFPEVRNYCITGFVFPDTLQEIGEEAFYGCCAVAEITIPDSCKIIGKRAFSLMEGLKKAVLPGALESLENQLFYGCKSLEEVNIPDSALSIGDEAFEKCTLLKTATIGKNSSLRSLGEDAFYDCKALTEFNIPDGVNSIGIRAFGNCSSLETITVPDGVTSVEAYLFAGCKSLKQIVFPENIEYVGECAFRGVPWVTEQPVGFVVLGDYIIGYSGEVPEIIKDEDYPSNAKKIAGGAFFGSDTLTEITFLPGADEIGNYTFSSCKSLTKVIIPDTVKRIGDHAFAFCTALQNIEIPDSVLDIGDSAFSNCKSLESIVLSKNLQSLGEYALDVCASLSAIMLPDGLKVLSRYCFATSGIQKIELPESVETIEYGALDSNNLLSIRLNKNLKSFDGYLPDSSIVEVINESSLELKDIFSRGDDILKQLLIYKTSGESELKEVDGVYIVDSGDEKIVVGATDVMVEELTLPLGVTIIRSNAFKNCNNLKSIRLSDGLLKQAENNSLNERTITIYFCVTAEENTTWIGNGLHKCKFYVFETKVYYNDFESSWDKLSSEKKAIAEGKTVYFRANMKSEITEQSGNYWHLENGRIIEW